MQWESFSRKYLEKFKEEKIMLKMWDTYTGIHHFTVFYRCYLHIEDEALNQQKDYNSFYHQACFIAVL